MANQDTPAAAANASTPATAAPEAPTHTTPTTLGERWRMMSASELREEFTYHIFRATNPDRTNQERHASCLELMYGLLAAWEMVE